jgi:hypothetical protein
VADFEPENIVMSTKKLFTATISDTQSEPHYAFKIRNPKPASLRVFPTCKVMVRSTCWPEKYFKNLEAPPIDYRNPVKIGTNGMADSQLLSSRITGMGE